MEFICEKYLLLTAILTASHAASAKSTVQVLEGLLIEAEGETLKITGYDLKTGIVTTIPAEVIESGGIVLNAKLFGEIIRKAPGQFVKFSVPSGYAAKITSELSEYDILGFAASDYPELPTADGQDSFEIVEATLKKMISQTCFAVSDNESRPILTGALFETGAGELTIVAVDGYRLALRRESLGNEEIPTLSFVVPAAALNELEKIMSDGERLVTITPGSKLIVFTVGETMLVSRKLEGEFYNYKNPLPQPSKYKFTVDKDELISAVERVSLVISDKMKSPLRCIFGERIIKLNAASALGKASDECSFSGDGEGLEMGFNDRYLLDALKAAPASKILLELTSGVTPCLITPADDGNSFLYMVLPIKLKAYES